jgi:hypothetical protein
LIPAITPLKPDQDGLAFLFLEEFFKKHESRLTMVGAIGLSAKGLVLMGVTKVFSSHFSSIPLKCLLCLTMNFSLQLS